MDDGVEFSGRTVDDAIAQASETLGAPREDLLIEVVSQGSRGVFGIGAEAARVRARVALSEPQVEEIAAEEVEDDRLTVDTPEARADLIDDAQRVLRELLVAMGFDAEVSVRSESEPIMLVITGENLGVLIGRRGDNLAALQFMLNLILSKRRRQWPRVVIDVENYRARREDSLRTLADRVAYRVRRNGRAFTLEAMPASDRRIIHLALRDRSDVETYSIGEGVTRRVVVAPRQGARDDRHQGYA